MEPNVSPFRPLEDDGMASYGLHPRAHEYLVRSANPALYLPRDRPADPLLEVQSRVGHAMRQAADSAATDGGLTLSA